MRLHDMRGYRVNILLHPAQAPNRWHARPPLSLADTMLSPVSRAIARKKKISASAASAVAKTGSGALLAGLRATSGAGAAAVEARPAASGGAAAAASAAPASLPVILGSSSSSRKGVISAQGVAFTCLSPDIDEKAVRHADPYVLPLMVARAKAQALLKRITTEAALAAKYPHGAILITADQVVLSDKDEPREKPESAEEAAAFVRSYSGSFCKTVSAMVVTNTATRASAEATHVATVHVGKLSESDVQSVIKAATAVPLASLLDRVQVPDEEAAAGPLYGSAAAHKRPGGTAGSASTAVEMADVMWCAGALCIEHPVMASRITRIEGGIDSVHGLPWAVTAKLMAQVSTALPRAALPVPHAHGGGHGGHGGRSRSSSLSAQAAITAADEAEAAVAASKPAPARSPAGRREGKVARTGE